MEIKDETVTTDKTADGAEYIAEIDATYHETLADGTELEAEITTTADPNDPTQIDSHMTVTETAADGTETVKEYVTNENGTFIVEEESGFEAFAEAALGVEIDDNLTPVTSGGEVATEGAETDVYQADTDFQAVGETDTDGETYETETPLDADETAYSAVPLTDSSSAPTFETADNAFGTADITGTATAETTDAASDETAETEAAELAEQEAHSQAATDAQNAADEFVASGDYAAAAEARETAENESWEAGDDSMLGVYDAQDLTNAAEKQEDSAYYEQQETLHAQQGDYEAAREDADKAGYAMYEADSAAGGDDHTGQADAEKYNMDWAVYQEKQADYYADNAAAYAADGDFENAERSAASAADYQESADNYGDLGEHGGVSAVYDSSSEVDSGGTYDSTFDTAYADTSYDSGVDTSYDAGIDTTAAATYDSGTDDV